jgi:hypothetical protein
MSPYNEFFSKCGKFLSSFVDQDYPSPRYERFTQILVQHLLALPDIQYHDPLHPFHRYAAEDLSMSDSIEHLAADMEPSLLQEDLGDLRLAFFAEQGLNRPDVEWLLEYFQLYADATTGLGEFDEADWVEGQEEQEEQEEVHEDNLVHDDNLIIINNNINNNNHINNLLQHANLWGNLPLPVWDPDLIHGADN